jgi:uncharacterized protein YjbI with pentapeptide repeats
VWVLTAVLGAAVLGYVVLAVFVLPSHLVNESGVAVASAADRLKAVNDVRNTLLGLVTPLLAAVAGAAALLNFRETQQQNQRANALSQRAQVTDRFSKAIEQLGNPAADVRIGAIYALEQIARDSPNELHGPVAEVLTAFVREHSTYDMGQLEKEQLLLDFRSSKRERHETPKPAADVQAVLTVLGRRSVEYDHGELDLRDADLNGAELTGARLEGAYMTGVHLDEAWLRTAHLEGAWLPRAYLRKANLAEAVLNGANLSDAHLERALLRRAQLEEANLAGARLDKTNLSGANLRRANLRGAYLAGAQLSADLGEADLTGAHLEGVALTYAAGVTQAQLDSAFTDGATAPPGLTCKHQRRLSEPTDAT